MHRTRRSHNERLEGARERYALWSARGIAGQIAILDERLGEGQGAHKERARLTRQLQRRQQIEERTI